MTKVSMNTRYAIGPSIGIARLGNSPDSFYIEPDAAGALPLECDADGNILYHDGQPQRVRRFKDPLGRVRRQGALFRLYRISDAAPLGEELTLDHPDVASIEWTVHLANKKAAWFNFAELEGNLLYGPDNSYAARTVPLRNATVQGSEARQKLIIDPGPRTLAGRGAQASFDAASAPPDYHHVSFPPPPVSGEAVTTLGNALTDAGGRLVVLGGFGHSGGQDPITSFGGADTWHDDIADGPVTCRLMLTDGTTVEAQAWCIVGSPKFAPEIVNIVTLADTMWDVAVRHLGAAPEMFAGGAFRDDYVANFDRDIAPILNRPGAYRWVANTPSMNSLSPAPFDARDASDATAALREAYFAHFREPSPEDSIGPAAATLLLPGGFPMMPLNSGSNSVSNTMTDKFLTLTQTQYFLLRQWAAGRFTTESAPLRNLPTALSEASLGNCVGGPFCPGIEVTWSTRNPNIYARAYAVRHRHSESWYAVNGLSPEEDETASTDGCEPGDLTKRMAIPWQADFFQCSIQFVNFTDPAVNKGNSIPQPPTYYAYWWPPQSPWVVLTGDLDVASQRAAGTPAGYQVLYTRGINTFAQMITAWSYMGFIANQAAPPWGQVFPYLTEQERNHGAFIAAAVAVGDASNVVTGADGNFSNAWFMPLPPPHASGVRVGTSRAQGRVSIRR
jgi:L-Lysine epsilon oxidase N-terminal/L-lysine epsilon oxidase C-terminal domain